MIMCLVVKYVTKYNFLYQGKAKSINVLFGNVNVPHQMYSEQHRKLMGVVNLMVGYLFVLYKRDNPRKKVRTVLRRHFGKISVI